MRVLMVCRKYSGISRDQWRPAGSPAIFKLIERLEELGHPTTVLFLEKQPSTGLDQSDFTTDYGLFEHVKFRFIRWRGQTNAPNIVSDIVNSFRQFLIVFGFLLSRADVLYFDRSHLTYAAVASLFRRRVVWRCLGVMSFLLARDSGRRIGALYFWYARLLVRLPYRLIICTNDGSAWQELFSRNQKGRTLAVLTNGVNRDETGHARRGKTRPAGEVSLGAPKSALVIGYVGRVTVAKGIDIFVRVLAELSRRGQKFHAVVVGYGKDLAAAKEFIDRQDLGARVHFTGKVPHGDIHRYLRAIDIYVSPARNGSLSNTTLEALSEGRCVAVLEPDPKSGIDVSTPRFVPPEAMLRVRRKNVVENCAGAISRLLSDRKERESYQAAARKFAARNLPSWDERIDMEIGLLEAVAAGRDVAPLIADCAEQRGPSPKSLSD